MKKLLHNVRFLFVGVSLLSFSVFFGDCRKSTRLIREYFIFGTLCGECGDPSHLFLIKNNGIYPDVDTRQEKTGGNHFSRKSLGIDKFNIANALPQQLPAYLEENTDQRFGCPGCNDGLAIYIEQRKGFVTHWWMLQLEESALPPEIRDFATQVKKTLVILR